MTALNNLRSSKTACHPTLILMSDTNRGGIVYVTFLVNKVWLPVTLRIFICSQAVLRFCARQTSQQWARFNVFAFLLVYSRVIDELIVTHLKNAIKDHKQESL